MFLVDEIDRYLAQARKLMQREDWAAIAELLLWERLTFMFGQVTAKKLPSHRADDVAVLVHIRSFADLALHAPNCDDDPTMPSLVVTLSELSTMRTSRQFSIIHRVMFDLRLSQCTAAQGNERDAMQYCETAFDLLEEAGGDVRDMAALQLLRGSLMYRRALATTEDRTDKLHGARLNMQSALRNLRRVRAAVAPSTKAHYQLTCIWLAAVHRELGHRKRAALYAFLAKRLHFFRRQREWRIDYSPIDHPLPFILPAAFQ